MDYQSLTKLGVKVIENALLKNYTTFRLGGPCPILFECATPLQIEQTVKFLLAVGQPFYLIGGGSNLLVFDGGLDCAVIRYLSVDPQIEILDNVCRLSASTVLDDAAAYLAVAGFEGLNFASGIPGTVGGAVVGNAGAFGRQIGDHVREVDLINIQTGQKRTLAGVDLDFAYRYSCLKNSSEIIISVTLEITSADKNTLFAERTDILKLRASKHPDWRHQPSAGSFFRNIEPTSQAERRQAAGWFLERAGALGLSHGGAYVYPDHANIITTRPHATASDVYQLSLKMSNAVKQKFQLDLQPEVCRIGIFAER